MLGTQRAYVGLAICLLIGALSGCAGTTPESIATIEGPAINGVIARPLEIIGVINLSTASGNVPDASGSHFVRASVEVPPGTALIVPAVRGWGLGYGTVQPSSANPDAEISWKPADHHWGLGNVEVSVVKIHPPNMTTQPTTQIAEISVRFFLSDDNQDDEWFGAVDYTLLCLGVPGVNVSDWQPFKFDRPKMTIMRP